MNKVKVPILRFAEIQLDRSDSTPLHRQLYHAVRQQILTGQLAFGAQLPPSRTLCQALGVSRNTLINAFDQLIAEGYLEGRAGSGTFVIDQLPETWLQVKTDDEAAPNIPLPLTLSKRGARIAAQVPYYRKSNSAFVPGLPAIDAFPFDVWGKIVRQLWQEPNPDWLSYGDPLGHLPLRQAIAEQIYTSRGVVCSAEQVIITSGTQEAMSIAARLLLDPGDQVSIENPGYRSAQAVLRAVGAELMAIPLDDEGLDVDYAIKHASQSKMVYVTPSQQYPMGMTMSLARRAQLLEWAGTSGAWILEDDYNSEYRFGIRPVPALQALDQSGRVLYIGTFSKVMFPAIRMGYIIVPKPLIEPIRNLKAYTTREAPKITQMALTEFINEGHFGRHLRRMRTLYAGRRAVLIEEAAALLPHVTLQPGDAGMHIVGLLQEGVDDEVISAELRAIKIDTPSLSSYSLTPLKRGGLVFGYGAVGEPEIRSNLLRMKHYFTTAQPQA